MALSSGTRWIGGAALATAVILAACTSSESGPISVPSGTGAASTRTAGTCNGEPDTLRPIQHVVVIMAENVSIGTLIGGPGSRNDRRAPFLNRLARDCGLATNYHVITQPSHPNYVAVVAGSTHVPPSCHDFACTARPLHTPSLFGQLGQAGLTWRVYVESMSTNCQQSSEGPYEVGHNPAPWFVPLREACARYDVPIEQLDADIAHDRLPNFSWIVPNDDHNMHVEPHGTGGEIRTGDAWLRRQMTQVIATPGYRDGSTVLFITWDEGDLTGVPFNRDCLSPALHDDVSCRVATLVVSKWVATGTTSDAFLSHFGLLKTVERLFGLPLLLHAGDPGTRDLIEDFGLSGAEGT